jgi:tetratricopeptide (TPR) repeat protein
MKPHTLFVASVAIAAIVASPAFAGDGPNAVYSANPKANALFLEARDYLSKGDPRTGGTFANGRKAIALYQEALKADPKFALAEVDMARAWLRLGYSNPGAASDAETMPPVRAALRRAVEIDPNLPDAHLMIAAVAYNLDYDWATADREYRRGLELQPDNADAHANYAAFLGVMGRFPEALAQATKAEALATSAATDFAFARIYFFMRRYDTAAEYCQKSLAKQDNQGVRFYLGLIYAANEQYDKAIPELQKTTLEHNGGAFAGLAYAYAMTGKHDLAQQMLDKLFADRQSGLVVDYRVAAVYLALGDKDQAMEWLNMSYNRHENWTPLLKVDPAMDPLRSDPRFVQLMQKMGLT